MAWLYQPLLPGGAQQQSSNALSGTASQNITPSQTVTGTLEIAGVASQNVTPALIAAGVGNGTPATPGYRGNGLSLGLGLHL